jgi:hypothetical protein
LRTAEIVAHKSHCQLKIEKKLSWPRKTKPRTNFIRLAPEHFFLTFPDFFFLEKLPKRETLFQIRSVIAFVNCVHYVVTLFVGVDTEYGKIITLYGHNYGFM